MKMAERKTFLADEKKANKRKEFLDNLKKDSNRKNTPTTQQKKKEEKINIIMDMYDGKPDVKKMARGGRAGLKGGGICKKGMNPKARGKNS